MKRNKKYKLYDKVIINKTNEEAFIVEIVRENSYILETVNEPVSVDFYHLEDFRKAEE